MLDLATLGWDDGWNAAFEPYRADGLVPGRVPFSIAVNTTS